MGRILPRLEYGARPSGPRRAPACTRRRAALGAQRHPPVVREHSFYPVATVHPLACLALAGARGAALVLASRAASSR